MDIMILANELNLIGKLIYNNLYSVFAKMEINSSLIGAFGITVIIFTLIIKIITMPFDVWQKVLGRKNARLMKIMQPELEKINKQCGTDKQMLMTKQNQLYKKHGYSAFNSCLPMIISLVIFMTVFTGFNSAVKYHNLKVYEDVKEVYISTQNQAIKDMNEIGGMTDAEIRIASTKKAEEAVVLAYKPESFLLTKNIFSPDNWSAPVPTVDDFVGTGMGKLGIKDVDSVEYTKIMKPIIEKYNTTEDGKKVWNGFLLFPILSFGLSMLSSKLIKPMEQPAVAGQTEEQKKAAASQQKMMTYMMPVMMCVFTLFYSTAFNIYYVLSNIVTVLFNVFYNIVSKKKDSIREEQEMRTTLK